MLAVLVAHGGSVVGDEAEWQWFCCGSSSLCRDISLFFFLLFFYFWLLFLLYLSLFRSSHPSVFSFSFLFFFLSHFCLFGLLSLFIVPCFLLSILFYSSLLFFNCFSLLSGCLFLVLSNVPFSVFLFLFFFQNLSLSSKLYSMFPVLFLCIFF